MDFVSYADSLRAKLHLGGARLPILVGVTALAIVALVGAGWGAASLISSDDGLVIERAAQQEQEQTSQAGADEGKTAFVHVGGAVCAPGLYELPADARVQQAIDAAGGFAEDAAVDAVNLARVVSDGEQIIVASQAAQESGGSASDASAALAAAPSSTASGKININLASAAELQQISGVGPSLSERIVADREANGPFKSVDDLTRVSGIGEKKLASMADSVCVG